MQSTTALVIVLTMVVSSQAFAQSHSKYVGQEQRTIKSLSPKDIAELQRGGGWGFAKIAELNGIPGPLHLLELKDQIALTAKQVARISAIYKHMQTEARTLGRHFIGLERALDRDFRNGSISEASLTTKLERIATVRAKLRGVHLNAHLEVRPLLSGHQIASYNRLRGYSRSDPCKSPPKGHDINMWRKHNGCQ